VLFRSIASLDLIARRVAEIRVLNSAMLESMIRQTALTDEAGDKVDAISEIADQTADQAQSTRKASEKLLEVSEQLNLMVQRFKLR
jgi:methyl-accepting chemotaxis protein